MYCTLIEHDTLYWPALTPMKPTISTYLSMSWIFPRSLHENQTLNQLEYIMYERLKMNTRFILSFFFVCIDFRRYCIIISCRLRYCAFQNSSCRKSKHIERGQNNQPKEKERMKSHAFPFVLASIAIFDSDQTITFHFVTEHFSG